MFSLLLRIQLISLSINTVVGTVIGLIVYSNISGFDARQGVFLEVMLLVILNVFYLIPSSSCYLILIQKVKENHFLRILSFYIGILIFALPATIFSIKDMARSSMHSSQIMCVINNIVLIVIWTFAFIYFTNELKTLNKNKTPHNKS